ncbi:MAG: PKD domain-containing protein [Candidatus Cryptobacteroides sp.]
MKKYFSILIAAAAIACAASSCQKDPVDNTVYTVEYQAPTGVVGVGNEVVFADLSLNATSRAWTFEDGEPASSQASEVKVKFQSAGQKTVTLAVTFKNNKTITETIKVTVADPIQGTIAAEGVTPLGCIKTGAATKFSIADATGDADKYEWTFEGGTPATSTEANPVVTFENANRLGAAISCKLTRSADGASETVKTSYIIGRYPVNRPNAEAGYDPYSFEMQQTWVCGLWTTKEEADKLSFANEGAEGTAHSLKVPAFADCAYPALVYRDNWCTNSALEPGKKYVLSFDHKAVYNGEPDNFSGIGVILFNQLSDWSYNPYFDIAAGSGFDKYRTDAFVDQAQIGLFEIYPGISEEDGSIINEPLFCATDWKHVEIEFTCPDLYQGANLLNVWPYLVCYNYASNLDYILIDEVYISIVEE